MISSSIVPLSESLGSLLLVPWSVAPNAQLAELDPSDPRVFVPAAYVVASGLTFGAYAWDKWRATKQGRRVPESTLHVLELVGGWPGALVAMRALRHKSAKRSFKLVTYAIAIAHVGAWIAFAWWRNV